MGLEQLRVGFFGTPEFAAVILQDLVRRGVDVAFVVTTPDKPQGRGRHLQSSAVKIAAEQLSVPVLTPLKHRDPMFVEQLKAFHADVFVVVAYKILPEEVFGLPRLGTFNIHASLLPKYRGAAPINWAIIRGEVETGLTTFLLDSDIDTGKLLLQERMQIGPDETAGELHDRMMHAGGAIAARTLELLATGRAIPHVQSADEATSAPKIFPSDCEIDFSRPASDVHNFIRGLSPHPGARWTLANGVTLKVLRAKVAQSVGELSSQRVMVLEHPVRVLVGTSSLPVELIEVQAPGKRVMSVAELLRGHPTFFSD